MKKTILLLSALCFSIIMYATVSTTISVTSVTAGGLSAAITAAGGDLATVSSLTVSGAIDARDFKTIKNLSALQFLDLSKTTILSYYGAEGCANAVKTSYNADELPAKGLYVCEKLNSVVLPPSIVSIGELAFASSAALKNVTIPPMVASIGAQAFQGCTSLTTVNIPSSVKTINTETFYLCSSLTSIILPTGLTKIDMYAFRGCTSLTAAAIPSTVTSIDRYAFDGCTSLTSLSVPLGLKTMGIGAFRNCTALKTVVTPFVFSGTSSNFTSSGPASTLSLPEGQTAIQDSAFLFGLSGITSFTIPATVTSIGRAAFACWYGLKTIVIPSSVTTIGRSALASCSGLTDIYAYSKTPVNLSSSYFVFDGVDKTTCVLHVPTDSKKLYAAANQWKDFTNIVEAESSAVNNATATLLKVNVTNGNAIISGLTEGVTITVYNLQGTAIYNQKATAETVSVNLPAHGVYVVKVGAESVKVVY